LSLSTGSSFLPCVKSARKGVGNDELMGEKGGGGRGRAYK
jgi:hypothetical protein